MRRGLMIARRGLRTRREGSTAVEFAFVALPFFMLLFAILEVGVVFVVDAVLESAAASTGRLVRTGQAQNQSLTPVQFKQALCSRMSVFSGDCMDRAHVDVRVITAFSDPIAPDPTAGGAFNPGVLTFEAGGPQSLVMVRVWYRQPIVTPFLAQAMSRMNDGTALLVTTSAFRNEPF